MFAAIAADPPLPPHRLLASAIAADFAERSIADDHEPPDPAAEGDDYHF